MNKSSSFKPLSETYQTGQHIAEVADKAGEEAVRQLAKKGIDEGLLTEGQMDALVPEEEQRRGRWISNLHRVLDALEDRI